MALNSQQQAQLTSALQSKGYSSTDAANAAANAGGRAMDLYREYVGGGSSGGSGNYGVDQATEQLRKAISISTDALKGQQSLLPQQTAQRRTQAETQRSSLEDRYNSLIGEVKEQTANAVNRTTGTSREELARRGINLQGNLAQQEVNAAVNPLNIEGGRQITNIGLSRESDLRTVNDYIANLPLQEQEQWLKLQQIIGQTQTAGSQAELDLALKLLANEQTAIANQKEMDLKLATLEAQKPKTLAEIALLEAQTRKQLADIGKTTTQPYNFDSWAEGVLGGGSTPQGEKSNKTPYSEYTYTDPNSFDAVSLQRLLNGDIVFNK